MNGINAYLEPLEPSGGGAEGLRQHMVDGEGEVQPQGHGAVMRQATPVVIIQPAAEEVGGRLRGGRAFFGEGVSAQTQHDIT